MAVLHLLCFAAIVLAAAADTYEPKGSALVKKFREYGGHLHRNLVVVHSGGTRGFEMKSVGVIKTGEPLAYVDVNSDKLIIGEKAMNNSIIGNILEKEVGNNLLVKLALYLWFENKHVPNSHWKEYMDMLPPPEFVEEQIYYRLGLQKAHGGGPEYDMLPADCQESVSPASNFEESWKFLTQNYPKFFGDLTVRELRVWVAQVGHRYWDDIGLIPVLDLFNHNVEAERLEHGIVDKTSKAHVFMPHRTYVPGENVEIRYTHSAKENGCTHIRAWGFFDAGSPAVSFREVSNAKDKEKRAVTLPPTGDISEDFYALFPSQSRFDILSQICQVAKSSVAQLDQRSSGEEEQLELQKCMENGDWRCEYILSFRLLQRETFVNMLAQYCG